MIRKGREMIVDRIDLHHGLLDQLKERKVISEDDIKEFELQEEKVKKEERVRVEYHEIMKRNQNERLLKCLRTKKFNKCQQFMKSLEESGQKHLANYLLNFGGNNLNETIRVYNSANSCSFYSLIANFSFCIWQSCQF